ncbi:hypothetical protein [Psychrobacter sp. I-STPA10]|uniref:hypothetical protein n=1 Tax=Psychrobacter sp. I-STPA10 TaxID=2585769 RepID=UPI001E35B82D|nr:hypothetical protein [Psychrobacter sp. I-STPA10]
MNQSTSAFSRIAFLALFCAQMSMVTSIVHANDGSTTESHVNNISITHASTKNSRLNQVESYYHPQTYCTNKIESLTKHPEHESILRHDIDCMMTALKPYQQMDTTIHPNTPYFAYKAQAWLSYAYSEDSEKSLTNAGAYALNEGLAILKLLKENKTDQLMLTTNIPPTSAIMRPDLWSTLMALKENGAITIAPRELAYGEVQLIWAAAEYCEFGWRHSNEHFRAAQRWINVAQEKFINSRTESDVLQFQRDNKDLFPIFNKLDTGDNQCRQNQITSITIRTH